MKANMGIIDRIIRTLLAVVVAVLFGIILLFVSAKDNSTYEINPKITTAAVNIKTVTGRLMENLTSFIVQLQRARRLPVLPHRRLR